MAESLLLPVIQGVAGKAADVLVQSVTRMWGIEDSRRKLERQLLAVQCMLADAEVKGETNPAVRRWMKDLRAVAYQADDVLDDFQYEALRLRAQAGLSTTRKVLSYFTHQNPLLFRLTASRNLSYVLNKISELVLEMNNFGLVVREVTAPVIHPQTHSSLDDLTEIVGRNDDKEMVVKVLLEQRFKQKVEVLPIVGMGGLGKTTLAKMVYNDFRVQQHFELLMWLCVSDDFNVSALVRSVIELATRKECSLPDRIELLHSCLNEMIGRKRYLLVLDDVWNEAEQKWRDLRSLLCSAGASGSVVIVTTRSQQVASIMGTLPSHTLSYLNQDDSWELFRKKAFCKDEDEQPELVVIGKRIVKRCKGLPLALKAIGGLMCYKQQVQEWEAIAGCNSWDDVGASNDILSILKLSYLHLSLEMRQCFAFCAVYPQDYRMERDMLIQLWIANNFIHEEGILDLEERGQFIFNELLRRSFFQEVKLDTFFGRRSTYTSNTCSMHDLMHDLAKSVTNECADTHDLNKQNALIRDVRHMMSSVKLQENSESFEDVLAVPLRTLLSPYWSQDRNINSLNLMSLRALQCASLHVFHKELGCTRHLRYLDLSNSSELVTLPNSVCTLYSLHTLRLNGCENLEHLPEGMRFMSKLRHIYLVGCCNLKCMPPGIGLLKSLRTLTTYIMSTKDGRGIEELKDLQLLGGRLELWNLKAIKNGSCMNEANLHLKENLKELLLHWGHDRSKCRPQHEVRGNEEILEFPLPPKRLESLQVSGSGKIEISSWLKEPCIFQCLKELKLSDCWKCKDLPPLWQALSLESLCLSRLDNLTTLSGGIDLAVQACNGPLKVFPKLKKISLYYLANLEKWMEDKTGEPLPVIFPELKELQIHSCPKLVDVPKAPCLQELDIKGHCEIPINSLSHLNALSLLEYHVSSCDSVNVHQVIPLSSWPSLVTLRLGWIRSMILPVEQQSLGPLESIRSLWIFSSNCFFSSIFLFWEHFALLEELVITGCDDLVHWPAKELCCLNRLQHLKVGHCRKLIGPSSEESLLLPLLVGLHIEFCDSLCNIPKLPTSLERLTLQHCGCLVSLPSNLGSLARMTELKLLGCEGLNMLPDGMDRLIALQELWIRQCPGIETLPGGLLQLLPTLRKLMTLGSPELELRCRRGGEYWAFVANIPYLNRDVLQDGPTKGFVKRFVPCFRTLN